MQYELHITRADHWSRNRGREILGAEWLSVVEQDSELVLDPSNGDLSTIWSRPDGGTGVWFDWCGGNVYTSNPDQLTLAKALGIARLLRGRVQGDDGTEFTTHGQALPIWKTP